MILRCPHPALARHMHPLPCPACSSSPAGLPAPASPPPSGLQPLPWEETVRAPEPRRPPEEEEDDGREPLPLVRYASVEEYQADLVARAEREIARRLRRRCREDLATFAREAWPIVEPGTRLVWGPHLDAVCFHVQRQLEERGRALTDEEYEIVGQRLGINIPPRSGKSVFVQVLATAWAWLRWPTLRVGCFSANGEILSKSARSFRVLIASDWYRDLGVDWSVRSDQDALLNTGNTEAGSRGAMTFGTTVTGSGYDWMIIDDPHGADDSEREIETACSTWDSSLGNRVNDPRTFLMTLVMQRLREHDLTGHLRAQGGWSWLVIQMERELPGAPQWPGVDGLGGEVTVYGWRDWRSVAGEVMHPRFTAAWLASERRRLGAYGYAGQMQQRPAPLEGGMVKRADLAWCVYTPRSYRSAVERRSLLDRCVVPPSGVRPRPRGCSLDGAKEVPMVGHLVLSIDPTGGSKRKAASEAAMLAVAAELNGAGRYLLDRRTKQRSWVELQEDTKRLIEDWPTYTAILVENTVNGRPLIEWLEQQGVPRVVPWHKGSSDKVQELEPCLGEIEGRSLYLLDGAEWVDGFVSNLTVFPNGTVDDDVDALSQALNYLRAKTAKGGWKSRMDAWKNLGGDGNTGPGSGVTAEDRTNPNPRRTL